MLSKKRWNVNEIDRTVTHNLTPQCACLVLEDFDDNGVRRIE
jgi:hypothetical protein